MSKQKLSRAAGRYERDTKTAKDWIVEMYAPNEKENKWMVLAFPKSLKKSNGGYDYNIKLTEVLGYEILEKLEDAGIHYSSKARYVRALGLHNYDTAKYIADGMGSRLKNIRVNIW